MKKGYSGTSLFADETYISSFIVHLDLLQTLTAVISLGSLTSLHMCIWDTELWNEPCRYWCRLQYFHHFFPPWSESLRLAAAAAKSQFRMMGVFLLSSSSQCDVHSNVFVNRQMPILQHDYPSCCLEGLLLKNCISESNSLVSEEALPDLQTPQA